MGEIATFYTQLRTAEDADALPITVRSLETIIRLSTAVAKSRLAKGRSLPVILPQPPMLQSACAPAAAFVPLWPHSPR